MKKYILIILLSGVAVLSINAQPGKGRVSVSKNLTMANELLSNYSYYNAVDYLKNILEEEPDNIPVLYQLGDTYYKARDYQNAQHYFGRVLSYSDPATSLNYPLIQFYLAQSYKRNGRYAPARDQFEQFIDSYDGDRSNFYKNWSKAEITGCSMAQKMEQDPKTRVTLMGKNINSGYTDYAPLPLGDTTLIFSSIRSKFYLNSDSKMKRSDIIVVDKENGKWGKPVLLKAPQRLSKYHTGHGSYSENSDRFYFTRCLMGESPNTKCAVYVTEYRNEIWSIPLQIKEINIAGYKSTSPAVVKNGYNKERIYFSSNRPGGRGGSDIWYVDRDEEGNYSKAVNLGTSVNTSNNDITPYFDLNSSTLYFSSNGYPGIGGYDIMKVKKQGSNWGAVETMGSPVNSSLDDMYFISIPGKKKGYLVSNRNNQFGVHSETCCDKIFEVDFDYKEPIQAPKLEEGEIADGINVEGVVFGASDETIEELHGAKIQLYENINSSELLVAEIFSSSVEPYFFPLERDKKYTLKFTHPGYNTEHISLNTNQLTGAKTLRKDLYLIKQKPSIPVPPKETPPVIPPKEEKPVVEPKLNPIENQEPVPKSEKITETEIKEPKTTLDSEVLLRVSGMVYSNDGNKNTSLEGAIITVYSYNLSTNIRAVYEQLSSTSEGYSIDLKENGTYILNFKDKNHLTTSFSVSTIAPDSSLEEIRNVALKVKKKGAVFKIDKIYYEKNSYELKSESQMALDKLSELITNNPNVIIEIGSHTDSSGKESYNLFLSKKRAKSVVNYLVEKGANPLRLKYKGYGETDPIAPNDTEKNMQLNRRTEFKLLGNIDEE